MKLSYLKKITNITDNVVGEGSKVKQFEATSQVRRDNQAPVNATADEIDAAIKAQSETVRKLRADKSDKAAIDEAVKTLLALKDEFKTGTGVRWKPVVQKKDVKGKENKKPKFAAADGEKSATQKNREAKKAEEANKSEEACGQVEAKVDGSDVSSGTSGVQEKNQSQAGDFHSQVDDNISNSSHGETTKSLEEKIDIVVKDIVADIVKTHRAVKSKCAGNDSDKQIKKTLKRLSYHEKVQQNSQLFKEYINQEVRDNSTIIFSCKVCNKFSPTLNKVKASRHAVSHSLPKKHSRGQDRNYECIFCGAILQTKNDHVKHYQDNHCEKGFQTLKCTKCAKCFKDMSSLTSHIRRAHIGKEDTEKPEGQVCSECGKRLSTPKLLSKHMKTVHRGLKPIKCELCDKNFRENYGLKRHVKEVHKVGNVGEKMSDEPIKPHNLSSNCPVCDKSVKKLNWHLRMTHGVDKNLVPTFSKFKHHCEVCGKPFRDKCNLERHIPSCHKMVDDGRKCHLCGKIFQSKTNKETHIKDIHETYRMCEKCNTNFTDKNNFYKHLPCQFTCKCGKKVPNSYNFERHKAAVF